MSILEINRAKSDLYFRRATMERRSLYITYITCCLLLFVPTLGAKTFFAFEIYGKDERIAGRYSRGEVLT